MIPYFDTDTLCIIKVHCVFVVLQARRGFVTSQNAHKAQVELQFEPCGFIFFMNNGMGNRHSRPLFFFKTVVKPLNIDFYYDLVL